MDLDVLKGLFEEFDLAAFLPDLTDVLGWIEMLLRIAVMAGPLLLLLFGLIYLLVPPKEANHGLGYRCWWGMASLAAWQFTQQLAGIVWTVLGVCLTVAMALICNGYRDMDTMDMVWSAVKCLGWEAVLTVAACVIINITVFCVFDRNGYRRGKE